jgi:hypothetical protein
MGDNKALTCPNIACNRVFTAPIKTLNLQENPSEPYFACPFCLTKIEAQTGKHEIHIQTIVAAKPLEEKPKNIKNTEKPASCTYHLGYLSERGQKEIPEDCLLCRDIVSCMLKKMRE